MQCKATRLICGVGLLAALGACEATIIDGDIGATGPGADAAYRGWPPADGSGDAGAAQGHPDLPLGDDGVVPLPFTPGSGSPDASESPGPEPDDASTPGSGSPDATLPAEDAGTGEGSADSGVDPDPSTEPGALLGITRAHNEARAAAFATPALPPLVWSSEVAAVAQAYAETLAAGGCNMEHSGNRAYGENLAWFGGREGTAAEVVSLWMGEESCYTYGRFMTDDQCVGCDRSGGCGHYTQVLWRNTTAVGCGMAPCPGQFGGAMWVCNYDPPGNYIGQYPY